MPKNLFQSIVFTLIMVAGMVYGMVVYNVMLATGSVSPRAFLLAFYELPIMLPIGFVLEFIIIGKLAKMAAAKIIERTGKPHLMGMAIPFCMCMLMCPTMSMIAMFLFKDPSVGTWLKTWGMNLPVALLYQFLICGPIVRALFAKMFAPKASFGA